MIKKMLTVMFMLSLMTVSMATVNPPSASAKEAKEYSSSYYGPERFWAERNYRGSPQPYVFHSETAYGTIYRGYLYWKTGAMNVQTYEGYLYREDQPYPVP
ncbi:hypothetical protein [Pseudalkalibacillus sp. SCS-8]|uniref:hypothetical protein n=1 Tax=Pseudalkalibacillus nanhaiensis TaxID=3115291 RepID=UPI0032DA1272